MPSMAPARVLAALAAGLTGAVVVLGGAMQPGYSHVADYISELGAVGAPHGQAISVAGFLPIGLLVMACLVSMAPHVHVRGVARIGYWLLLANGVSYVGAAFVPCDMGCPASGSDQQALHNLLGLIGYGGSGVGLLLYARGRTDGSSSRATLSTLRVLGVVVLACLFGLGIPDAEPVRGLIQRIAECCLSAALLLIAWRDISARPPQGLDP